VAADEAVTNNVHKQIQANMAVKSFIISAEFTKMVTFYYKNIA
jgi:hypothetical protein